LFFSSNGHPGMGGLDLFEATGSKNNWTNPQNLKYPINSPRDDFAIIFKEPGTMGYFASNRNEGVGSDDIYSFEYSPPPPPEPTELILAVKTMEKLDDGTLVNLPGINVHYHFNESTEEISVPEISPGVYHTKIKCDETYMVHGTNPDFFANSQEITTKCETMNDTVFVEFVFDRIVIDKPIVIENIYYDYDKWNIRPDAAVELDNIVELLTDNPHIIIELGSHTDSRGSKRYNENLSQKRAESAVQYIVSNGISQERITAKGYGEYQLVNHCSDGVKCSEEEHQMNRRTEFRVIGLNKNQPVIDSASR
jgi:outer membrane protein OmpA-like peptidoglycan-associated protein